MIFSALLLALLIHLDGHLVSSARTYIPRDCPKIVSVGDTCWKFDAVTAVGTFYYGNDMKYHAWHVARTKFNGTRFAVMPEKEGNRGDALSGLPRAGEGFDRDEKPLSSMRYRGTASVCRLPTNESRTEGGMTNALLTEIRDAGPRGRFVMIDNRSDIWRESNGFPPSAPSCLRPAGKAIPIYPKLRVGTTASPASGSKPSPTSKDHDPPAPSDHDKPAASPKPKRPPPEDWIEWLWQHGRRKKPGTVSSQEPKRDWEIYLENLGRRRQGSNNHGQLTRAPTTET